MELSGSIEDNLQQAVHSATRLRGHPVYPDTLKFWAELMRVAHRSKDQRSPSDRAQIEALLAELEGLVAER